MKLGDKLQVLAGRHPQALRELEAIVDRLLMRKSG